MHNEADCQHAGTVRAGVPARVRARIRCLKASCIGVIGVIGVVGVVGNV